MLQRRGQIELMRIFLSPYSAAKPLVAFVTAALLALYHTRPGRGRVAPIDATGKLVSVFVYIIKKFPCFTEGCFRAGVDLLFIIEPPSFWFISAGMKCLDDWHQIR